MENSVLLHRVINAPISRVFRAFVDPKAISFWYPPYGFLCEIHQMDSAKTVNFTCPFTIFQAKKVNRLEAFF